VSKVRGKNVDIAGLAQGVLSGDRRSIARMISIAENSLETAHEQMEPVFSKTGQASRIGITGPPGSGKSTLVDALTSLLRKKKLTVGIVAIDPTSPFTGGALLGDRIRMQGIGLDPDVFIRSMATRGSLGGLCAAAGDAADILDASGKDIVITETVGVGQSEVEIARVADTTLVVLCPEAGDAVQTMKAGLMEIADIFVINKADKESSARLTVDIRGMIELKTYDKADWKPPVVETSATQGTGMEKLYELIENHRKYLEHDNRLHNKRVSSAVRKIQDIVISQVEKKAWRENQEEYIRQLGAKVVNGEMTPYAAAGIVFEHIKSNS